MLYIYLKQTVMLNKGERVALRDIAQLAGANSQIIQVKDTVLGRIGEDMLLITAADVAAALKRDDLTFLGAPACAVQPRQKQDSKLIMVFKTVFVAALMFVGGAMTVISYQTDVDMPEAHLAITRIFTGSEETFPWITIAYCVGVSGGVLFFTNVIPGKKKKPTLFELEEFAMNTDQQKYDISKAEEQK